MTADQLYAIIGSNVVAIAIVGGVVGTFFWRTVARLDRHIDESAAERRAFQAGMDTFRTEMQRLAERQSHIEGARTAGD